MEMKLGHIRAAFYPLYVCKCWNTQEILLPKTHADIIKLRMMEEKTPNLNIFPDLILHKIQRISPSLIIWHALVAVPSLFNRRPPSMGTCKPLLWSFWPLGVPLVKLMPHRPGFLFLDLVGRVQRCHKYNLHRQKAHKTIIPQVGIYILCFIVSNTYVIKILPFGWQALDICSCSRPLELPRRD